MRNNQRGMTLIEILIVVAILAVIVAIVLPRFVITTDEAKKTACAANIRMVNTQWEVYNFKTGAYGPLNTVLSDSSYFPDGPPVCPYGTTYEDFNTDNRVDTHAH